ncbi:MAG TPA: hypothetical protein PLV68_01515, partial [Ilumatobacteraceae bacterium]|nr:hypothetical protein [Ilumatobacteraceae bacterium]
TATIPLGVEIGGFPAPLAAGRVVVKASGSGSGSDELLIVDIASARVERVAIPETVTPFGTAPTDVRVVVADGGRGSEALMIDAGSGRLTDLRATLGIEHLFFAGRRGDSLLFQGLNGSDVSTVVVPMASSTQPLQIDGSVIDVRGDRILAVDRTRETMRVFERDRLVASYPAPVGLIGGALSVDAASGAVSVLAVSEDGAVTLLADGASTSLGVGGGGGIAGVLRVGDDRVWLTGADSQLSLLLSLRGEVIETFAPVGGVALQPWNQGLRDAQQCVVVQPGPQPLARDGVMVVSLRDGSIVAPLSSSGQVLDTVDGCTAVPTGGPSTTAVVAGKVVTLPEEASIVAVSPDGSTLVYRVQRRVVAWTIASGKTFELDSGSFYCYVLS